jgi:hypothetical protein
MFVLILVAFLAMSRTIRRVTRRTDIRNGRGLLIVGMGTAVSLFAGSAFFQLHGPSLLAIVASAVIGFWCLVAQALVGELEDPAHPNRFFH